MNIFSPFVLLSFLAILIGCGRIENRLEDLKKKAVGNTLADSSSKSFSIRSIVKEFENDTSIKEIKGVQLEGFLYVEYCVYKGNRLKVIDGVNKIVPKKVNDYSSDSTCQLISRESFFDDVSIENEKSIVNDFFWKFENLENYDVYTCIKAPLRHYIIFDSNSDTVYHRIEELRD